MADFENRSAGVVEVTAQSIVAGVAVEGVLVAAVAAAAVVVAVVAAAAAVVVAVAAAAAVVAVAAVAVVVAAAAAVAAVVAGTLAASIACVAPVVACIELDGGLAEDAYTGTGVRAVLAALVPCFARPGGCRREGLAYRHSCSEAGELASGVAVARDWSWVVASGRANQAERGLRAGATDAARGTAYRCA